jgi:hypothetical protein
MPSNCDWNCAGVRCTRAGREWVMGTYVKRIEIECGDGNDDEVGRGGGAERGGEEGRLELHDLLRCVVQRVVQKGEIVCGYDGDCDVIVMEDE